MISKALLRQMTLTPNFSPVKMTGGYQLRLNIAQAGHCEGQSLTACGITSPNPMELMSI